MASVQQAVASADVLLCAAVWDRERFLQVLGYTLLFMGAVLIAALVLAWVDRWRKRPFEKGTSAGDQLAHFRALYERGELSPEEFTRIRGLLGERLRQEMAVPAPPAPTPPAQSSGSPPPPGPPADSSGTPPPSSPPADSNGTPPAPNAPGP